MKANYRKEYRAWKSMIDRCSRVGWRDYHLYGGRGIKVCEAWAASFEAFLDHIGPSPSPSHSVDRIDVNGNYEPGNVRWATPTQQQRNRQCSRLITAFGQTKTLEEWSIEWGVNRSTIWCRLRSGWPPERAMSPAGQKGLPTKLTPEIIQAMRIRVRLGETAKSIAQELGVSDTSVRRAITGQCFKSVPGSLTFNRREGWK